MHKLIQVQKVTQDVLLFVWDKRGGLVSGPPPKASNVIPGISVELMNKLSTSVLIETFRTLFIWDDFFENHFVRMTSSVKLFVTYVGFACYVLNDTQDAFERFFDALSVVAEFSLRCLQGSRKLYINICVDLFCTFFEIELSREFENQGGWKNFKDYIEKQYNSIQSKSKIIVGNSPDNLFEYFSKAIERGNRPDYVTSMGVLKKRMKPYFVVNGIVIKEITQNRVETEENAAHFAQSVNFDNLLEFVRRDFDYAIRDFERKFHRLRWREAEWNKEEMRWDEKSTEGAQSKEGVVKAGQYSDVLRNQAEPGYSLEGENPHEGIQIIGPVKKTQQQPDGIKNQVEQCSLRKHGNPPERIQSKEAVVKAGQHPDVMKNQVEKCPLLKYGNPPYGMQSKEVVMKAGQHPDGMKYGNPPYGIQSKEAVVKAGQHPGGMRKQVEQNPLLKYGNPPEGIQSKGAEVKAEQYPDGTKNQVEQCSLRIGAVKEAGKHSDGMKNQVAPRFSKKDGKLHGIQSIEAVKEAGQYSDGMKNQVGTSFSQKGGNPTHGIQSKGAVKEAGQLSDGMKNQVEQCPSRKDENPLHVMQSQKALTKGHNESSDGVKSKKSEWNLVEPKKKKKEVPHLPYGMQSKVGPSEKEKRSFDGMKSEIKQTRSKEDRNPLDPLQSKEVQKKKCPKYSEGIKNQVNQSDSKEDRKHPDPRQSKEVQKKKCPKSSDGMKNQVKQSSSNEDRKPTNQMQNNEQREKDPKSSDGIKNQVKQRSSNEDHKSTNQMQHKGQRIKYPELSDGMENQKKQSGLKEDRKHPDPGQSKEVQIIKCPKSSNEMKNQVKQSRSNEDRKPTNQMQNKEQRERDTESSDEMKNYSLSDKQAPETVSSKFEVAETENAVGTVTDQVTVKTQNLVTKNSPQFRPIDAIPVQASRIKLSSATLQKIKKLLGDISLAFAKNCEIIHSECEKYGVQIPEHLKLKL